MAEWTPEEWEEKKREVPVRPTSPKDWPKGIRPVTLDEQGLGVDREGNLYWQLKPVAMKVKLRWIELTLAVLATAATIAQAATAMADLIHKW